MIPERTNTPTAHELLQRFHGAKYLSFIDLSNAFLQSPLEESLCVWTAFHFFHFEVQTYQLTRVPFGSVSMKSDVYKIKVHARDELLAF
jgi:hypothetical protein